LLSIYFPARVLLPVNDVVPDIRGGRGMSHKGRRIAQNRRPHESRRMVMSMALDVLLIGFMIALAAYFFSVVSLIKIAVVVPLSLVFIKRAERTGMSFDEFKAKLAYLGVFLLASPIALPLLDWALGGQASVEAVVRVVVASHALHGLVHVLYLGGETVGLDAAGR
jgi:hypothetical protein